MLLRSNPLIFALFVGLFMRQVARSNAYVRSHLSTPGFYHARVLSDGEREKKVHWKRVTAIETTVEFPSTSFASTTSSTSSNSANWSDFEAAKFAFSSLPVSNGLVLRQVTDGRHFIQLIYDSGWELRDCEYLKDKLTVHKFLSRLSQDFNCARAMSSNTSLTNAADNSCDHFRNDTFQLLRVRKMSELPLEVSSLTNYRDLKRQCHDLHQRIRSVYEEKRRTPSTLGSSYGYHQQQQVGFLDRVKRDLFLYPGTNWCGSGSSTRKFSDLGYNAAADRCCRDHDHCPFTIEAFTDKFNFFNYRFHTISNCDCDERFRACLKLADTATSNMVGRLFFNVVQTKCFNFKAVKVCMKRSWWGKCLKHEKQKTAHLKDALTY